MNITLRQPRFRLQVIEYKTMFVTTAILLTKQDYLTKQDH